jgi:hypothetical protein
MPFGSSWGSYWGGGSPVPFAGFFLESALASGSSTFQVAFSEPPKFSSPIGADDAANLDNWTLTNEDTGQPVSLLAVSAVPGEPAVLQFTIFGRFTSALTVYRITGADALVSAVGNLLVSPKFTDFFGMPASVSAPQATPLLDIDSPQSQPNEFGGALVVDSSGDYRLQGGPALLKKLIFRRLTTAPGEFYHLSDQDYGVDLRPKELFTPQDLVALKTTIERQVLREPEVAAVRAVVTLSGDNVLTVALSVQMQRTNQRFSMSVPLSLPGAA